MMIDNPAMYPDPASIEKVKEPFIRASIIIPDRYMGAVMKLCMERRGINKNYQYLTSDRMEMIKTKPLYDRYPDLMRQKVDDHPSAFANQKVAELLASAILKDLP